MQILTGGHVELPPRRFKPSGSLGRILRSSREPSRGTTVSKATGFFFLPQCAIRCAKKHPPSISNPKALATQSTSRSIKTFPFQWLFHISLPFSNLSLRVAFLEATECPDVHAPGPRGEPPAQRARRAPGPWTQCLGDGGELRQSTCTQRRNSLGRVAGSVFFHMCI